MTFLPIIEVFRQPFCVNKFSYNDWQELLEQSYANKMTARVKNWLKINGLSNAVPEKIQWHFDAAWNYYLAHKSDVIKECELIHSSLGLNPNPVVFLKGAAYMLSQSLVSEGRLFGDIDILTAKSTLHQTEKFLLWSGWRHSEKSDYDQSYYREWMHELPPLVHGVRGTTLDVHHNILPPISGRSPEISEFPIKVHKLKEKEFVTFSAPAMTLHSIVHLFFEEDFSKVTSKSQFTFEVMLISK